MSFRRLRLPLIGVKKNTFHLPRTLPGGCWTTGLSFLFLLLFVRGALGEAPISLSLDRADGLYAEGETAEIQIAAAPGVLHERTWSGTVSVQRNWEGETNETLWNPEEPLRLSLSEEAPGQVIVTAILRADDDPSVRHVARTGFLYRPEKIDLATPEPDDFDAFWDRQKENWRALSQTVELDPVDSSREDVITWDLTIHLEGETPVHGYLAMPSGAASESLPALLTLHGAGVRSSGLSTVVRAASDGFMALDINAHGLPNGMSDEFYAEKAENELRGYRQRGVEARETWYFRTMYLRVLTAIDYLSSRGEWNGRDLALHGSSQGGGQALAGAGLDQRVSAVAVSVPALCDLAGVPDNRRAGWPQPVSFAEADSDRRAEIAETVAYFDGGLFARRIDAPVIVSLGLADPVCSAQGIQATVNNLAGSVKAIYRPSMSHAYPGDIQREFNAFIKDQVSLTPAN